MLQLSHPCMTTGKTIALTRRTFVSKVVSLLFNTLSRFVIAFLSRSSCLLIPWLQSLSALILEPRKIKYVTFSPSICHEVIGPDAVILISWMLSFKPTFSLSSSSRGSLVPIHLLPLKIYHLSIYMSLLIFLPAILVLPCESSSPAFHMMYTAYKLNKQGDTRQPLCIPFTILNQSFFHVQI